MFRCPVDVTSRLIVSIRVFRWCKCCASCNNMFYVFFCLIAHPAFLVATWCSSADNTHLVLDLGLLLLNSLFLPLGLSYITTPGIFLYLQMVFQIPGRIVVITHGFYDSFWLKMSIRQMFGHIIIHQYCI
jgi:hypothetical protein